MINIGIIKDEEILKGVKKDLNFDVNAIDIYSMSVFEEVIGFVDILYINVINISKVELVEYVKLARVHGIKFILHVDIIDEEIFNVIKDGVDKIIEKGSNKDILKGIKDVILRGGSDKELKDIIKDDEKRLGYDLKRHEDSVLVIIDIENYLNIYERDLSIIIKNMRSDVVNHLEKSGYKGFDMYQLKEDQLAILMYDSKIKNIVLDDFTVNLKNVLSNLYSNKQIRCDVSSNSGKAREFICSDLDKYIIYDYGKNSGIPDEWEERLDYAFMHDKILLYYQPILDNNSDKIASYEALVRLEDSEGVIYGPFDFLGVAKDLGVYDIITQTVILKVLQCIRETNYYIAMNITYEDIYNDQTRNFIINELDKNKDISKYLSFEITEAEQIVDYELVKDFIMIIKSYGCGVSVDDFGSGYSNYLKVVKLNIDTLKIDGEIIKVVDTDNDSLSIVKSIVGFSKDMGIKTVAEYVCNKTIYDIVKELGIDFSQGYYIGKPTGDINEIIQG